MADNISQIIRERLNIVDIVSQYIPLNKRGKNYVALCPFHSEKTPSFTVSEEKQIFHCFGCGAGGDIFSFVMKQENLTFPDALRLLAEKAGVELKGNRREEGVEELYEVTKEAMEFYHRYLLSSSDAEIARRYLYERGINEETIERFKLGYAERGGVALPSHLRSIGISIEVAKAAGIVTIRGGRPYDYLRGRITFPIFDVTGRVVAFGGRVIGEGLPKYLNSPESPLFKKRRTLYGLNLAKERIAKEGHAIIVEGYMDLLVLHQCGIKNVVATLGTALTTEHINELKRYAKVVYPIFDSDEAGRKAAIRSLEIFLNEDVEARAVLLPEGKDPDQFVRERGGEGLREEVRKAVPLFDFYLRETSRGVGLDDLHSKVGFIKGVTETLSKVRDPLLRSLYVKRVAERFQVDESALIAELNRKGKGKGREEGSLPTVREVPIVEETIIWALLHRYDLTEYHIPSILASFEEVELKRVGELIVERIKEGHGEIEALMDLIDEEVKSRLSRVFLLYNGMDEEEVASIIRDCVRKVKLRRLKKEKEWLKMEIKKVEKEGREDLLLALLRKRQELTRIEHSPGALLHYRWGGEDEKAL